jgi:hypothetical protein
MMNWLFIFSKIKDISPSSLAILSTVTLTLLSGFLLHKTFTKKDIRRLKRKLFWQGIKSKFKRHGNDGLGCFVTILLILVLSAIVGYGIYYLVTLLF